MARSIPKDRFHDLIEAATAVFLEQGYRRTQMADVAARMGVAKGTRLPLRREQGGPLRLRAPPRGRTERIDLPDALPVRTPPPGATLAERPRSGSRRTATCPRSSRRSRGAGCSTSGRRSRRSCASCIRCCSASASRSSSSIAARPTTPSSQRSGTELGARAPAGCCAATSRTASAAGCWSRCEDSAISARMVLETAVFWAVHRHWDPSPQVVDESVVEATVVAFVVRACSALRESPERGLRMSSPDDRRYDIDCSARLRDLSALPLPRRDGLQPGALLPRAQRRELVFCFIVCGFIGLWHMPLFFLLAGWSAAASLRSARRAAASCVERVASSRCRCSWAACCSCPSSSISSFAADST